MHSQHITFLSAALSAALLSMCATQNFAQAPKPSNDARPIVRVDAPLVALKNVRVIDGTGGPPKDNQTVVIDGGRIRAVGSAAGVAIPEGARTLDMSGRTVLPGLVLLHEHFFNVDAAIGFTHPLPFSVPRLLLAYGVTTVRTAGAANPYMDLNLKQQIDAGQAPGPEMFVTSPFLNGPGKNYLDVKVIRSPEDARRSVRYWAAEGVTSFKAYRQITKEALSAIIDEAHGLGLPVTAHLESVTCREAAELGIDNIEHGCIGREADPNGAPGQALIRLLVDKRVAVTFTLGADVLRPLSDHELELLDPGVRERYLRQELRRFAPGSAFSSQVQARRESSERFLLAFARAGGRIILGTDAGCCGLGILAGLSGHVAVEMLVRLGFPPLEAMRIATLNGATFLGIADRAGSIAAGKEADLLVVRGDPSARIEDIEQVETVWSNGVQYDPQALLAQVKGEVGWR